MLKERKKKIIFQNIQMSRYKRLGWKDFIGEGRTPKIDQRARSERAIFPEMKTSWIAKGVPKQSFSSNTFLNCGGEAETK